MVWTLLWNTLRSRIASLVAPLPVLRPAPIRRGAVIPRRAPRRRTLEG